MEFMTPEVPGLVTPPEKGLMYYGIVPTGASVKSFTSSSRDDIPDGATKVGIAPGSVAEALGKRLQTVHELEQPASKEDAGRVFHHSDGGRVHSGICVGTLSGDLMLLFMTTNVEWNPFCRRITRDEHAMTGFPSKNKRMTYLAPVIRPDTEVTWTEVTIPEHRSAALRAEFFKIDDLDEIRLL